MTSQIKDLADKIEQADGTLSHMRGGGGSYLGPSTAERGGKKEETQLRKVRVRVRARGRVGLGVGVGVTL